MVNSKKILQYVLVGVAVAVLAQIYISIERMPVYSKWKNTISHDVSSENLRFQERLTNVVVMQSS